MSKGRKYAAIALLATTMLVPQAAHAQAVGKGLSARTPGAAGAGAGAVDALAASREILRDVARIRRLDVLKPVPSGIKSRADIEAMVLEEMERSATDREFRDATSMLRFLGLVPDGFELRRETAALLTEQVAGFYTPRSRFFFLADWIPVDQQRAIIAHELTHALTDQHFDLRRFEQYQKGNSDARLAVQALIEGDATAVMLQYSLFERGVAADLGAIGISLTEVLRGAPDAGGDQPVYARTPPVLRETLQFPYAYGAGFVQQMLRAGSWQRVNSCYAAPPASTEQILHPEKYFDDERPEPVTFPDLSEILGSGWRRADDDVNGEFGLQILLKSVLDAGLAEAAAAGWAGDRYHFYVHDERGAHSYVHASVWDSEAEAVEFAEAYARRLGARFAVVFRPEGGARWHAVSEEGEIWLERRGRHVVAVEGFRGASLDPLLGRIWKAVT